MYVNQSSQSEAFNLYTQLFFTYLGYTGRLCLAVDSISYLVLWGTAPMEIRKMYYKTPNFFPNIY